MTGLRIIAFPEIMREPLPLLSRKGLENLLAQENSPKVSVLEADYLRDTILA